MAHKKNQSQKSRESEKKKLSELEKVQRQAKEYLEGWQRAKADYINLKREYEKKQKQLMDFAKINFVMDVLPIYDNLKLALSHAKNGSKENDIRIGIEHIVNQFKEFLDNFEIKEIPTIGERFNPEFHEAVKKEKKEGIESGIIIEEVKSGYMLKDKVLIPSKVVVAE